MPEKENAKPISAREKVVLVLAVFLIKMLKPWEFDHQFKNFWDEIKEAIQHE